MSYILPAPKRGLRWALTYNTGSPLQIFGILDKDFGKFGLLLLKQHIFGVSDEIFPVFLRVDDEGLEGKQVLVGLVLSLGDEQDIFPSGGCERLLEILKQTRSGQSYFLAFDYQPVF